MFDTDHTVRLTVAGVVLLVGLSSCIAWISVGRRGFAGLAARVFMTAGLAVALVDLGGAGTVLGLCLAVFGGFVAWEGQPAPEVPRPPRRAIVVAALITGVATLAMFDGWGPLARVPSEARAVATLAVATTGVLATLAAADRSRIALREAVRRRFGEPPPD